MELRGEPIRVQALAETVLSHVPPQYIQQPHNRPAAKGYQHSDCNAQPLPANINVPVINLLGFDLEGSRDKVREAIGEACREWGAFHVINHGIPGELLERIRSVGISFFNDHPISEKLKYACDPNSPASEGYGSRMLAVGESDNTVLDWRDYFDHHTLPLCRRNPSRWPLSPPEYRQVIAEYSDRTKVLAQELLGLISESLDLPTSCIEDSVGKFYQNITISYYPPCPRPDLTLGLQPHSDMGAITLLIQDDVGGLEVFKDGEWILVQPLSDAILVILSDQTEIITNGEYRSSQHRAVTNASRARLSVATFHDPAKTMKISPASELVSRSAHSQYREVLYGDYVSSWYTKGPDGKRNIDALLL